MTKTIALALAAALTGTVASANSYLSFTAETQERDSVIELNAVQSEAPGVVEIYEFHAGEIGDLLGSEFISAGANADVRVNLGREAVNDVVAVLKIDGLIVDTQEIEFE